jgi:hypothetical protein
MFPGDVSGLRINGGIGVHKGFLVKAPIGMKIHQTQARRCGSGSVLGFVVSKA